MPGNAIQRAKARRSGEKAWMVGEPINGVGNYIFGRRNHTNGNSNNELFRRTPLGNTMPGNSAHLVPKINQLSGVGRYRSQYHVDADAINVNQLKMQQQRNKNP